MTPTYVLYSLENRAILHSLGISQCFSDTLDYKDQTATRKQTNLVTYLLCSPLCSPPGTGAHLMSGTGPVPPTKEDRRTPPKLPKLEHVAFNSASETGAKMHQNAQIRKLNF